VVQPHEYVRPSQVGLPGGSTVMVTADHPFYVDAGAVRAQAGWVEAGHLLAEDRLRVAKRRVVEMCWVLGCGTMGAEWRESGSALC